MEDENLKPARLTLEINDQKISVEMPWDVPIDDMLSTFYGMCITATWQPVTVLKNMKEFAEEKLETLGYSE